MDKRLQLLLKEKELESLIKDCSERLGQVCSLNGLEEFRCEFLGRKGRLAQVMFALSCMSSEAKPIFGRKVNEAKVFITKLIGRRENELAAAKAVDEISSFDPSFPGRRLQQGSLHPVTLVTREICDVFTRLSFEVVSGREVEDDWHNFEALNMSLEHPARDMQDTFYITNSTLLRTHTSPLQVHTMLIRKPPLAIIAPGKVYRRDSDLTHTPMFHQIEGFLVDSKVSMADLRGTLTAFLRQLFGAETKMRFRPSFFPFTEPSAEADITCMFCDGRGDRVGQSACRVCKNTGWVEILGCGMIDPNVFQAVGYDPEQITGFAFGLGVERVAMLKYGIGDLRMFFENDIRFLEQFS